jgi:hypothetical protein
VGEGDSQVVDDLVYDRVVCDEGNDLHLGSAGRRSERINLVNLPYEVVRDREGEHLMSEYTSQDSIIEDGDGLEGAIACAPTLRYKHMEMQSR